MSSKWAACSKIAASIFFNTFIACFVLHTFSALSFLISVIKLHLKMFLVHEESREMGDFRTGVVCSEFIFVFRYVADSFFRVFLNETLKIQNFYF